MKAERLLSRAETIRQTCDVSRLPYPSALETGQYMLKIFAFFDELNFGFGVLSHPPNCISLKEDKRVPERCRAQVVWFCEAKLLNGGGVLNITLENLQAMKESASEPVDKKSLVDIRDVKINQGLPVTERILQFITLTKNPYLYKHGDRVVKVSFAETDVTFEERMKGYFEML